MQNIRIILWLLLMICIPMQITHSYQLESSYAFAEETDKIRQLVLEKIKISYANLKDIDALEEAGMKKEDIYRLRHASKLKLQELENSLK